MKSYKLNFNMHGSNRENISEPSLSRYIMIAFYEENRIAQVMFHWACFVSHFFSEYKAWFRLNFVDPVK